MPAFEYKAVTSTGQIVTEVLDAPNEQGVSKELYKKGYRPISITKKKGTSADQSKSGEIALFKKKIKTEEIVLFTRELVTLLKAGVPMLTALEALSSQATKEMGEILNKIYVDVMSGRSFSQALAQHPKVFSTLFVNSVHAGEMSGSLDEVLERMAVVLKKDEETRKKVKSAMKYPTFVTTAMAGAFVVLMTQVVPKFAAMFEGLGTELPIFTRILMGTSNFVSNNVLYILAIVAVSGVGFTLFVRTEQGRLWWDGTKMKIPVMGELVTKSSMARFTMMFETLNRSGLPILQTLNTVSGAVGNAVIEKTIKQVASGVERGQGIAGSMKKQTIFPKMVVQMIAIGEQSGSLDDMLNSVSNHYDTEVEYAIKGLTQMIEPILTVAIGGMVVVMALGIFLPMWSLIGAM